MGTFDSSRRYVAAAVGATLAMAHCSPENTLELTLLTPEQCSLYCIDELQVIVGGDRTETVPCGAPVALSLDSADRTSVEVETVGPGFVHRAAFEADPRPGRTSVVDVTLIADEAPRIDGVIPQRSALLGPTPVDIRGARFGRPADDPARLRVEVAGQPARIIDWTSEALRVETSRAGPVTVAWCGVSSEPADLVAGAVVYRDLPSPTDCPRARLVAADGSATRGATVDNVLTAAFSCDDVRCERTQVVRFNGASGAAETRFEPVAGCPFDIARASEAGVGYLALDDRVTVFRSTDGAEEAVASSFRINTISVARDTFAVIAGRRDRPWVWPDLDLPREPAFRDVFSAATDLDGPYVVGVEPDGAFLFARVDDRTVAVRHPITCGVPRALARPDPGPHRSARVVVACDAAMDVFDNEQPTRQIPLPAGIGRVESAAMTTDGRIAVLYAQSNVLVYVGVDDGWATVEPLPPIADELPVCVEPRLLDCLELALVRAPLTNHFYLTGPRFDRLLQIDVASAL